MNNKPKIKEHLVPQPPKKRWGIDISSTKIEGIIIDEAQPEKALYRLRLPTERFCGYDHVLNQVQLLVAELESRSGMRRPSEIGVSTPGVLHPSRGILINPSTCCLSGHSIKKDLSNLLAIEVFISNDANCFALGETLLGAARGYNIVMGLIIETGIGAGIVVHGHLLKGLHGVTGEWGHNTIYGEETLCHCGKKGCNETVFSEFALERFYEQITGKEIFLSEIVKRANLAEVAALQTLEHLQNKFSEAIAIQINTIDPDAIVLGGNVGSIELLYEESTRDKIAHFTFNKEVRTPFFKPALGDSAKAFGAAMLSDLEHVK